ncbi:MAG: S8 family serine peptidase [Candidatus Obscuribacterales bacterium]|nr:S8 family serine peptidase [Candidatus Obscuribacterales bacterium]
MIKSSLKVSRAISGLALTLLAASLALPSLPAIGAPEKEAPIENPKLKLMTKTNRHHGVLPNNLIQARRRHVQQSVPNILLIQPAKGDSDNALDQVRAVKGTVVRTIGTGDLTTWVVEFEDTKQFLDAEKKLVNDKHFSKMQRDFLYEQQSISPGPPNDPFFSQQWYIDAMNVRNGWAKSLGGPIDVAVIDSGVNNKKNADLLGRCYVGYDAVKLKEGQKDVNGHGTCVSTTLAATGDNGLLTCGVAQLATIFPIRAGFSSGLVSTAAMMEGFFQAESRDIPLVNLSVNGSPPYTINNPAFNGPLLAFVTSFHNNSGNGRGGLVFNAAGNDGALDQSPLRSDLICVAAHQEDFTYTNFSNYGPCIKFSAPGIRIACSSKKGKGNFVSVAGTSFSSPLACAVAAAYWGANSNKTAAQVEAAMRASADNTSAQLNYNVGENHGWDFGWGFLNLGNLL